MSGRSWIVLAGAIVASLVVTAVLVVRPASATKPPRDFYGVVPQTAIEPGDLEQMQEDRVGIVRQLFLWPEIEPYPGQYDWTDIDAVMREASATGIEVFPVLYGIPAWAQSEEMNRRCGVTCAPSTSEAQDAFARFAAAAVARYGRGGSFWTQTPPLEPPDLCLVPPLLCPFEDLAKAPIEVWQVWNEQNSPKYYGPEVSVRDYAGLIERTAAAIRGEDPEAEVVLGGMWGPPGTKAVVPTLSYLERLYRLRDSRSSFDAIAIHPYAGRFASVKSQLEGIHRLATRVRDPNVGIWVTELGWASGGRQSEPLVKTEAKQATLLRKSFRFLIRKRRRWRIQSVHWYSWRDTPLKTGICAWCPRSGLRTLNGDEKPAAVAYRKLPRSED